MADNSIDFEALAKELAALNADCARLKETALGLADRADPIIKQSKRNMPVRDTAFEEEFRSFIGNISSFFSRSDDFWKNRMAFLRMSGAAQAIAANHLPASGLLARARQTHNDLSALCSALSYLHSDGKSLPMRLNWFALETSCSDFTRLSSRIALVVRELSKYVKEA